MLFDSHSHLHSSQFDGDREEIIKKLCDFDIKTINVGTDFEESKKAVKLAKKYPDLLWASVGLHPNNISTTSRRSSANGRNGFEEDLQINRLRELTKDEKVVAIGECGLDYYRIMNNELGIKEKQKDLFVKHIELSKELWKPLILHCRPSAGRQDAYEDVLHILDSYFIIHNSNLSGVVHFFSGSKEIARKFLDLGFYISFAGPITFASEYRDVVEFVPINRILIETDAPFAAPVPYRGQRNEPSFVEFTARKIGELKNLSFEEVTEKTFENTNLLFLPAGRYSTFKK